MLGDIFYEHWLPGVLAWIVTYISDYVCTIASARLYRAYAKDHIVFEGSFELNPVFERDVNKLRWLSPRFVVLLIATSSMLAGYWVITQSAPDLRPAYAVGLGALLLTECAVHMRHVRNLALFRALRKGGMSGQVVYERGLIFRSSHVEFLSFAVLFSLMSLLQCSWFLAGGAFGCFMFAVNHRALARKWDKRRVSAP